MSKAIAHLKKDPVLKKVIAQVGESYRLPRATDPFADLIDTIVSQQLSTKAATTIFNRIVDSLGKPLTPRKILAAKDSLFRTAGVSRSKTSYIKNVAKAIVDKDLNLKALESLPDDQVIKQLINIKGLGPWSADMYLMFILGRPDIFPVGDGGIQAAMRKYYRTKTPQKMIKIATAWSPHRSLASGFLWKSLDNTPAI